MTSENPNAQTPPNQPKKGWLSLLGPGFITGASDDDPSGIGTYAMAGAVFGYATLWLAWVCYPLMAAVQLICARIGMVSGMGLGGVLRKHYPRPLLYTAVLLLVIANTINAGADIGAIAAGINLFVPIPIAWLIVPLAVGILLVEIFGAYCVIERIFKWLACALLGYIVSAFFAKPNWHEVLIGTFMPHLHWNGHFLAIVVAFLGTTISPYLFFWQASQEVEEEKALGRKTLKSRQGATDEELRHSFWDVNIGMLLSEVVAYFIILSTGATLFQTGHTHIQSAADAAQALRPLAGPWASALFGFGIIGTGLLAVPILTGASGYAIAEAFGWRHGLDEKPKKAKRFYGVIAASTLIGMLINFVGINPIDALFWTAVINGLLAPPLLVIIMLISNNQAVMGCRTNGFWLNLLGWVATALMALAAAGLLLTWGQ